MTETHIDSMDVRYLLYGDDGALGDDVEKDPETLYYGGVRLYLLRSMENRQVQAIRSLLAPVLRTSP